MNEFTYGDLRAGLLEGKMYRHKTWSEDQYIMGNIISGHFEVIRFREKYTETFPIGLYFDSTVCDYVEYTPIVEVIDHTVALTKLSKGEKLTHRTWGNAYIYNEAISEGKLLTYSGTTMKYWKQPNGNIITEPYHFNKYDKDEWISLSKDEVEQIWGYHPTNKLV